MGAPDIWLLAITVPTDIPDEKLPLKNTSARITFQGYADNLELNVKFNVMWGWPSSPFLSQPQSNSSIHWPTCRSVIWLDCQVLIIDAAETSRFVHKKLFSLNFSTCHTRYQLFFEFFFYHRWKMVFCMAKKRRAQKEKRKGETRRSDWEAQVGVLPRGQTAPLFSGRQQNWRKVVELKKFQKTVASNWLSLLVRLILHFWIKVRERPPSVNWSMKLGPDF